MGGSQHSHKAPRLLARAVACVSMLLVLGGSSGIASAQQLIQPAPAFNAERLSTLPRDEWITNGGTLANQRYSPLTSINCDNVANLRGVWRS